MTSNRKGKSSSDRKRVRRKAPKATQARGNDATYDVVARIADAIPYGSSRSTLADACRRRDARAIVSIPFPDISGTDVAAFASDYLCYNILRKYSSHELSVDREAAALAAFHSSEVRCAAFNEQGEWSYPYDPSVSLDLQVTTVLHRAREIISRILGELKPELWMSYCTFSSGASTHRRRKVGDAFYKLQGTLRATSRALPLLRRAIRETPLWHAAKVLVEGRNDYTELCRGSKYITVPKDWKTERGITPEPEGNMYLQAGLGRYIRHRLRKWGLDLNTQERNQQAARLAWFYLDATLDLSQASDSVSVRICNELIRQDWLSALLMTRSPETQLPDGSWHTLSKISSMGNGYTFELESLIFYGISLAVCELSGSRTERVCVYGDDIIVPQASAPDLIRVLNACGFVINTDKSFIAGNFFESCGKHYFHGVDVTPFFIKEPVDTHVTELCRVHNRMQEHYLNAEFQQCMQWLRDEFPSYHVPPTFPDKSGYWSGIPKGCRWRDGAWVIPCWTTSAKAHEVGSNIFGYLRSLLVGSSSSGRSIRGYMRGGYWCYTADNCPLPEIGVSDSAVVRKDKRIEPCWDTATPERAWHSQRLLSKDVLDSIKCTPTFSRRAPMSQLAQA